MAPAPPPPPGPPPPPLMPLSTPVKGENNQRGLLLQSIRDGTKLKKTVTVDKSSPFIPGKSSCVTSSNSLSNDSSRNVSSNVGHRNQMNVNGGVPPGLGNLFAHGMPKLKPTGLSIAGTTALSSRNGQTLKGLSSETKTRGPPPQPPPASQKPIFSSASDTTSNPIATSLNGTSTRPAPPVLPNKPPAGGYGKPNVAPKPPVAKEPISPNQSSLHSQINSLNSALLTLNDNRTGSNQNLSVLSQNDQLGKPSPPPKKTSMNGRPGVNRAQSMRAPRSPPVAPTMTPPFPPNVKQSLVKTPTSLHQSQDSLNSKSFSKTGTLPHNFIQKVAQVPPSTPPPPAPSQRGTPTRPPVSRPPPPPSRPAAPPAPPPPPPHRTSPAPPPPTLSQSRLTASSSGPPAPPTRNSSMRNGGPTHLTEIEDRFSNCFHSIHEFPEPGVYRNVVKNYNTRTSANAKQPAPQPPVHPHPTTHVQLNSKLWVSNTSQC